MLAPKLKLFCVIEMKFNIKYDLIYCPSSALFTIELRKVTPFVSLVQGRRRHLNCIMKLYK